MGGISAIQNRVDERANPQSQTAGQEIFFKDGDQAFLTPVASGDEDDLLLDEDHVEVLSAISGGSQCGA